MRALEFFQDDAGQLSSTRLVFILWGFTVLGVWAVTSIQAGIPQPIDEWVAATVAALMAGKVGQKFSENK